MWGEHIHQCQRVGKLDGVQASEQIMRFGEAGGQVRARQSTPLAGAGESGHGMSCEDGEAAAGGGLLVGRRWFERVIERAPEDVATTHERRDGKSSIVMNNHRNHWHRLFIQDGSSFLQAYGVW